MELLGSDSGGISDWTLNPAEKVIRPIYGMHFYVQDGKPFACRPEDIALPECVDSEAWMDRVKVLSADIFSGKQFSLRPPISP